MAGDKTDEVQAELKRGIDFYSDLDAQILAMLSRLAEVLEESYDLPQVKRPFAKYAKRASYVEDYLLVLRPVGAELESDDSDDELDPADAEAEDMEQKEEKGEITFGSDARLPYVIVQMTGKTPAKAQGSGSPPLIRYGVVTVAGRKDGKPLDSTVTMKVSYYLGVFRNRVCNPKKKPPYTHKSKKGAVTLRFDEGAPQVQPLASIQGEGDVEELAKRVAALVGSQR